MGRESKPTLRVSPLGGRVSLTWIWGIDMVKVGGKKDRSGLKAYMLSSWATLS